MNKILDYHVTGQNIELSSAAMLVAGTVNEYTARFSFGADWDGYQRIAVFSADGTEREKLLTDDTCKVPWEVLLPGAYLKVGVYGTKDGSRLPTIWTSHRQYIHDGAGPTEEAADPSPTLVEQLLARMGDLSTLETDDKSSLVAAINEVWSSGGRGGSSVTDALINEDGHLIIILSTGKLIDAGYAVGPVGPIGPSGDDGKTAYQYAQDGGYAGTEAEFAAKLASEIPAVDDTLKESGKAADAKAVGDALSTLSEEIGNAGKPTDEQVSAAVNAYLDANPVSGGISTTAKNLLITILRSGVYTADQSDNITALETALGGGTTEPEEPDVPVETTYAINNELINCTSSNSATSVKENAAYSTTLTANDGYTLTGGTVTVTMGGVDITATAYADGVISIAAVAGDVEIFASAVVVQAEAALPEDGLIAYFDFRTTTYDNAGSGGKTTIAPTKGSGQLYMWANNSISAQNEYGLKPANTRKWEYDQNGGTTATALGDAFTVIQLTYGEASRFGFKLTNVGVRWAFYPQYINASGSTVYAAAVNGDNFNSDSASDYNFTVVRADGSTLTEIFDTSRTTYNGGDIDGFSRWLDTPCGNIVVTGDTKYCTAMAIYNRALTDSEIEAAREFMKTLEVTA